MKIGKDAVVMGAIPNTLEVGDGSVVIGPTDKYGNTIINTPMAVGRNAHTSGSGSIAIGAGANAGDRPNFPALIHELELVMSKSSDPAIVNYINEMLTECRREQPDMSVIRRCWEAVKASSSINGAITLCQKISNMISS